MESSFRLTQVLQKYAPGALSRGLRVKIETWTRERAEEPDRAPLDRHKVSKLLDDQEKTITLPMLNSLCEYLIIECKVPEHCLPHELFGAKERHLLDLIATTKHIKFFLGTRWSKEWGKNEYVMAADAAFQNKLMDLASKRLISRHGRSFESVETILVPAPPRNANPRTNTARWKKAKEVANNYVDEFERCNNTTLVACGSTKVNALSEQLISRLFGEQPHRSPKAGQRMVPFFVRYRNTDPQPSSSFGGTELSKRFGTELPGIYYQAENGEWEFLPNDDEQNDVAYVVYASRSDKGVGRVFVACGGFSSRATHYLTAHLDKLIELMAPPQINTKEFVVGMFLIQFISKGGRKATDSPVSERILSALEDYKVYAIRKDVLVDNLKD